MLPVVDASVVVKWFEAAESHTDFWQLGLTSIPRHPLSGRG